MKFHDAIVFASDAEITIAWGVGFLLLAAATRIAEERRVRRARIDRVGWMPWTGLFLAFAVVGLTLVGLGAMGVIRA